MLRLRELGEAVASALRNVDVRRVELCWGPPSRPSGAHFVAFGVFSYGTAPWQRSASPSTTQLTVA